MNPSINSLLTLVGYQAKYGTREDTIRTLQKIHPADEEAAAWYEYELAVGSQKIVPENLNRSAIMALGHPYWHDNALDSLAAVLYYSRHEYEKANSLLLNMKDPVTKSAAIAGLVKEMIVNNAPLAQTLEMAKGIADPGFKTKTMHEILIRASARGDKGLVGQCAALFPGGLGKDDMRILNYLSTIQAHVRNAFPQNKETDRKELEGRKEKAMKWIDLESGEYSPLNQPLFTNLQATIQSLNSGGSAKEIFGNLMGAARKMADMLIKFKNIDRGIE